MDRHRYLSLGLWHVFRIPCLVALLTPWGVGGFFPSLIHGEVRQPEPVVGGRCEYRQYRGMAEIVSISPTSDAGSGADQFTIQFVFHSQGEIAEPFARTSGKIFPLEKDGGGNPNRLFIEQHDIRVGRRIDCVLRVIVRGTCTPVMFRFPWNDGAE